MKAESNFWVGLVDEGTECLDLVSRGFSNVQVMELPRTHQSALVHALGKGVSYV